MITTIFFLSHRCCLGRLGLLCYPVVNSGPPLALPLVFGVNPILHNPHPRSLFCSRVLSVRYTAVTHTCMVTVVGSYRNKFK